MTHVDIDIPGILFLIKIHNVTEFFHPSVHIVQRSANYYTYLPVCQLAAPYAAKFRR